MARGVALGKIHQPLARLKKVRQSATIKNNENLYYEHFLA
jgi:hypothetical protein